MTDPVPPKPTGLEWDDLARELDRLSRSHRVRVIIEQVPTEDRDDLVQSAALVILQKIGANPELLAVLADPEQRRKYLSITLQRIALGARTKAFRRATLQHEHAADLDAARVAQTPIPHAVMLREIAHRIETATLSPEASFALDVLDGEATPKDYAQRHGVSERTARRRFVVGMRQLANLAHAEPSK